MFFCRIPDERRIKMKTTDELRELYTGLGTRLEILGLPNEKGPDLELRGLTRAECEKAEHDFMVKQCLNAIKVLKDHVAQGFVQSAQ